MKRLLKVAILFFLISPAFADTIDDGAIDNCSTDASGAVVIEITASNSAYPCEINTAGITEAIFTGTIEDLVTIIHAYSNNLAFGGDNFTSAVITANITNPFSDEFLTQLQSLLPAGVSSLVLKGADFVLTDVSYQFPSDVSVNFTDSIVHLPANATIEEAATVFSSIGDNTIKVAPAKDGFVIDNEDGQTIVHMPEGTSLAELLEAAQQASSVIPDVTATENGTDNPYIIVKDRGAEIAIHLPEGTSEKEALALVKGLNVTATVVVDNEDDFTISLREGKKPKVVYKDDNKDNDDKDDDGDDDSEPAADEPDEPVVQEDTHNSHTADTFELVVFGLVVSLIGMWYSLKEIKRHS